MSFRPLMLPTPRASPSPNRVWLWPPIASRQVVILRPLTPNFWPFKLESTPLVPNTTFGGIPVLGNPVTAAVNSTGASITVIPEAIASVNSGGSVQPGSIAEFQAAAAAITSSRSTNAGNLISLQNSLQVLESTITNQQAAIGQALDVSVVKEMMNLTSTNIMTDPAAALQAQAMQMSNAVFKLL